MVHFVKCSVVFHLQNYVSERYIELSLDNRVATLLGKGCHLFFYGCLIAFVCLSI